MAIFPMRKNCICTNHWRQLIKEKMEKSFKEDILRRIENRIRQTREMNPDSYRAYPHRYTLKPTLSEEKIKEFENHFGIKLPIEYRTYLKEIGNGGTHGILSLEDVLRRRFPNDDVPSDYLKSEFPLKSSISEKDLDNSGYFNLNEMGMERYWLDNLRGTIDIRDVACGEFDVLVVTGNKKGEIWNDVMYADVGIFNGYDSFWKLIK